MTEIISILESIKEIDHKILSELEDEAPSVKTINEYYDQRSIEVDVLKDSHGEKEHLIVDELDAGEMEELKNLVLVISLLEQKINKRLTVLLEGKAKALEKISMVKKAKSSYDSSNYKNGDAQAAVLIETKH